MREGEKQEDVNIWNGTVLAEDYEMARMITLGAMLVEWPMAEGWIRHEALVRLIDECVIQACMAER